MASLDGAPIGLIDRGRRRVEVRHVLAIAVPTVITTSSRAVMDVADFVMIKWMNLADAQAAILPAQMIMFTYIVLGMGIVSLVSTFAAQCLGKGQHRECATYGWLVLYFAAGFGLLVLAVIPFLDRLVAFVGHAPRVQELELEYVRVALLTAGPTIAASGLGGFFIGIHRPWVTMWSALEANVVNVVVSYCLIFGVVGEPMGIAGAAWGTLVGVSYRTVRLLLSMTTRHMNDVYESRRSWGFSWTRARNLLRVGMPCGLEWFSEVLVWALFVNVLIGRTFGTADLIATNTAWQYMRVAFLPTMGVGMALSALVGKSIGAGETDRAQRQTRIGATITLTYMGVLFCVYTRFGPELIAWFNPDPEVVCLGASVMICAAIFQLFDALAITYDGALRGAGDTLVPAVFYVISTWLVVGGGGYVAVTFLPEYRSIGPWVAAAMLIVITGAFLWWRWHSRAWMKMDIFKHTSTACEKPDAGEPRLDESPAVAVANE